MLASVAGDVFAIAAAVAILSVGVWASFALYKAGMTLNSTKEMIDGVKDETVPLLGEVRTTVTSVNKELERADGILESTGNIVRNAERVSSVVEQAVSSPLGKFIAFSTGLGKGFKKFVGGE